MTTAWKNLKKSDQKVLLYGSGTKQVQVQSRNGCGRTRSYHPHYAGVVPYRQRRHSEAESDYMRDQIEGYMREVPCPDCGGSRLKPESLGVTVDGRNLFELGELSITKAADALGTLELSERDRMIAEGVVKEVNARLKFLLDVGLDYLSLNRSSATLAGGEAQRIRLASQIGSGLVGVLYILDEPSIGLHQRDNRKLLDTLRRLRDLGNTVLVVEHDEETIRSADYVVDLGPGAGELGGHLVAVGTPDEIMANPASLTGRYLARALEIPVPTTRRKGSGHAVTIHNPREHNLKGMPVKIPLGTFTCVTGVSGSGKSTLVNDILYRALAQMLHRAQD